MSWIQTGAVLHDPHCRDEMISHVSRFNCVIFLVKDYRTITISFNVVILPGSLISFGLCGKKTCGKRLL